MANDEELQVMQDSIKHMRFVELWPQKHSRHYRLRYAITLIFAFPLILANLLHLIAVTGGLDALKDEWSEDMAVLSAGIGIYFMLISFVWQQRKIANLWKQLGISEIFGKPDNFEKRRRELNLVSKLYSYYCYLGFTIYYSLRLLRGPECRRLNQEIGLHEVCFMITPAWAPFDIESFPQKQILFGLQLFSGVVLCKGAAAVSMTTFEVAEYIVLKIKHLRRLLTEVFDDSNEEIRRKNLVFCIRYHQYILSSLQELFDKLYRKCNGCYVMMVSLVFASVANQVMQEHDIGPLIHLAGWLFSFYICCYSGQIVRIESLKIPDSALESKWCEASLSLQKDLLILVTRSQQPFLFHATPIGVMSLELFVAMLKTSYSYFTLLNETG